MKKLNKKTLTLFGCIALSTVLLFSCKKPTDSPSATPEEPASEEKANEDPVPTYTVIAPEGLEDTVTIDEEAKTITLAPATNKQKYKISGEFEGQIINKTKGTVIVLSNAKLTNTQGKAAIFGEDDTEISADKDTQNTITVTGTADKTYGVGAVQCGIKKNYKDLEIGGSGSLTITCENGHGVKADDIKLKGSGTFVFDGGAKNSAINCNVFLVKEEKTFTATLKDSENGIKADKSITINSGTFNFENLTTALKTDKTENYDPTDPNATTEHFISISTSVNINFTNCSKNFDSDVEPI